MNTDRILFISDLHFPYAHPKWFDYLLHLWRFYSPTLVIIGGDEIDSHSQNFHGVDPDLPGAADELKQAIDMLRKLHSIIPRAIVLESNHGSLFARKMFDAGLPSQIMRPLSEIYGVPGWVWRFEQNLKLPNGEQVYVHHGKTPVPGKLSKSLGQSAVQFHYHTKQHITYWIDSLGKRHFDAHCGALCDADSLALRYQRNNIEKPSLGTLMIIDNVPLIIPLE